MSAKRSGSWRAESSEVLYAGEPIVTVDANDIATLVREAGENVRRRVRLCTHASVDDRVHEMFIVHERACYVRPHKHAGKSESFHVVEGEVDVVIFDDGGNVTGVIAMGDYRSGKPFFYRIAEPLYHTLLIRSGVLVFHETTAGPLRREETVFPQWAPSGEDAGELTAYLQALEKAVAEFNRSRSTP
jgi:cupin fold WbuC family metalloprotein